MELLEEVLKNLWPNLKEAQWINVDILDCDIGEQILRIRIRDGNIDSRPIILYGFKSLESVVRLEKEYPSLMVSPGVHYLHLPILLGKVESLINRVIQFQLDGQWLRSELIDITMIGDKWARRESVLAHNIGNFLGPEKLLYGAHLGEMITEECYKNILMDIRKKQNDVFKNKKDYLLYLLVQTENQPNKVIETNPAVIKGQILYIDDHAHLGWAWAVASALLGKCSLHNRGGTEGANLDVYTDKSGKGIMSVINREGLFSKEDAFLNEALKITGNDRYLKMFDLILLDLRLLWQSDENLNPQNIDDLSGIKVLRKIRETNAAIPVVMLTASRKAKNMERLLELGADAYFIKETFQPNEKNDNILDYYKRFLKTIKEAMYKSYLSEAWRLLIELESYKPEDYINYKIDYHTLPDDFKIDWLQSIIIPLKKAIGFMRKENTFFETNAFQISAIEEAIINLNHPDDTMKTLNRDYKKMINPAIERIYYNPKPLFLNGQILLSSLRGLAAHGKHGKILEKDDGKIAMYLAFRSLIGENDIIAVKLLLQLIRKMFPEHKTSQIDIVKVKDEATKRKTVVKKYKDRFYLNFLADINTEDGKKPLEPDLILISKILKNYSIPIMTV